MERRFVDTPCGRVHVHAAEAGGGPPVVLVHGVIVSSRYLLPLARELEGELPLYAPDLPGYGRSVKPPRALDTAGLADALAATADALGLDRPVLLANSYGCQIVAELAATRPGSARACILVSPTYDPAASRARSILRWLANTPFERPSILAVVARDLADVGLPRAAAAVRHSLRHRIELRLPHVVQPTLVVYGGRDPTVPRRWAEEATQLLPNGRLAAIRDGPHCLNYSRPRELAALVRSFLAEL
jgi:2-hydroxy-6-oxonona-2,4-dienedioate hydrolase